MKRNTIATILLLLLGVSAIPLMRLYADTTPVVQLPPNTVLPLPVPTLEIRGFDLAIEGVSARTNNLIRLGFSRNARVETNNVTMVIVVDASMDILIHRSELLAAQTNYTRIGAMPIEFVTPIMYQLGVEKAAAALQAMGLRLLTPDAEP